MLEDTLRSVRKYYYASPPALQNLVGRAYRALPMGYRLGKDYIFFKRLLDVSEQWSEQQLLD